MADLRVDHGPVFPSGKGEDQFVYYARVFCAFLQEVFAQNAPGFHQWRKDEETTEVYIADVDAISREVLEKRPAILVKRGAFQFGNSSLDQLQSFGFEESERRHAELNSGVMSLRCIATTDTEASRLAWECAMAIRRLKRLLQRVGNIHRVGEDISVSEPTEPGALVRDSSNETSMVVVAVPFFYQDFWTVRPLDNVLLKRVNLAITSSMDYPAPGAEVTVSGPPPGKVRYSKVRSLTQRVAEFGEPAPRPRK